MKKNIISLFLFVCVFSICVIFNNGKFALANGELANGDFKQKDFFIENSNMTVTPNGESGDYLWIDSTSATGLVVKNSNPDGIIYTKAIDTEYLFGLNDYVLRLSPYSNNLNSLNIKLLDADNDSSFLSINWNKGTAQKIYGGWNNNDGYVYTVSVGCDETLSYVNTKGTTVNTDSIWSYGTMFQYEVPTYMFKDGNNAYYQMWTDINHDGNVESIAHDNNGAWTDYFFIKFNEKKLVSARGEYDIADSKLLNAKKVRMEISWNSSVSNDGICIKNIFGKGTVTPGTDVVDIDKSLISDVKVNIDVTYSASSLLTANDDITLSAGTVNGVNYLYDCDGIDWRSYTGLVATSNKTYGSVRYKNGIDLSVFSKDDILARLVPYSYNVSSLYFKLIDVANEDNYIKIDYTPSEKMLFTNDFGTCSIGSDCVISYYNGNEYKSLETNYEYGLILGKWDPLLVQFGNYGGDGIDIMGNGNIIWVGPNPTFDDSYYIDHFSLSYENGIIYTPRSKYKVVDFNGFKDDMAYLEIGWVSEEAGNGVNIDTLMGEKTYKYNFKDNSPIIKAPDSLSVCVDEPTKMFDVKIFDVFDGKISNFEYKLMHFNDGWEDKTSIIKDDLFTLPELGSWKIDIEAKDVNNNTTKKSVLINCVVKPLDFTWETDFYNYYFLGETFEFIIPEANMDASKYESKYIVRKNGSIVDSNTILGNITKEKIGEYSVVFSADSIYGSHFEKQFNIYFCQEPEFDASYSCEVDDEPSTIQFPVFYDGWDFGFAIYEQSDSSYQNAIVWKDLKVGTYNMQIIVSVPERNKEFKKTSTLVVKESTKSREEQGKDNEDNKDKEDEKVVKEQASCASNVDCTSIIFVLFCFTSIILILRKKGSSL